MTDPTEAIRKAHAAFAAFPSATTLSALHLACKPSALGALLDRLDSAERNERRYQCLRDGDDESVINSIYPFSTWENTHWLKRGIALDAAIDKQLRSVGEKEPK